MTRIIDLDSNLMVVPKTHTHTAQLCPAGSFPKSRDAENPFKCVIVLLCFQMAAFWLLDPMTTLSTSTM